MVWRNWLQKIEIVVKDLPFFSNYDNSQIDRSKIPGMNVQFELEEKRKNKN